jgi:hypothetical protein
MALSLNGMKETSALTLDKMNQRVYFNITVHSF